MIRFIFLAALNLALPFLIRAAWVCWRNWRREQGFARPDWQKDFNVLRLMLWGVLLMFITLAGSRFFIEQDTSFIGNQVRSVDY